MAICPYCGSQIGDAAEICGFCGGKLTVEAAAEALTREIPEVEAAESVSDDGYEGIPDDILGSVLGTLSGRQPAEAAPPVVRAAEEIPAEDAIPEIPTADELFDVPDVEAVPEIPVTEEIPEIPEIPEVPAAEEIPAAAEAEIPVVPAFEQPGFEAPVYAQPVEPVKKNKWLIPAIAIGALALICILFFALRGCGSKAVDPNVGVYKATLVEMYGIQLDPDEIYEDGFTIELKDDGTCVIFAGGDRGIGNWSIEDGKVTINDGSSTITGLIGDDVLKLENMLDLGLDITMEKQE